MKIKGFSNLSLKTKSYIFAILCLVSIGVVYKSAVDNKRVDEKNKIVEKVDTKTKEAEKQEITSVSNKDKTNKVLENKYEKSYKVFGEKKYKETIEIADSMIKEDPNFYKAYNIKGIALCYSNNFDEGMKNIDKALSINPNFGYARFNKALAYELFGQYDESLKWYDKNLEVENYVWSYYGKASIYGRKADLNNTIKYLKIAIEMAPEIKGTAAEEADFNSVKDSKEFQELIK